MGTEPEERRNLVVTREPKGPSRPGEKGSAGDTALMDGVYIIVACWAVVLLMGFTLRTSNS
jgi:hypothetical protein